MSTIAFRAVNPFLTSTASFFKGSKKKTRSGKDYTRVKDEDDSDQGVTAHDGSRPVPAAADFYSYKIAQDSRGLCGAVSQVVGVAALDVIFGFVLLCVSIIGLVDFVAVIPSFMIGLLGFLWIFAANVHLSPSGPKIVGIVTFITVGVAAGAAIVFALSFGSALAVVLNGNIGTMLVTGGSGISTIAAALFNAAFCALAIMVLPGLQTMASTVSALDKAIKTFYKVPVSTPLHKNKKMTLSKPGKSADDKNIPMITVNTV